jgi:hypothetical protein
VEHLCHSVAVINRGRLVAAGTVDELTARGLRRLAVEVHGGKPDTWAGGLLLASAVAAAIVIPNLGDEGPDTVRLGQVGTPTAETRETAEAAARLAGLRVELVTLPNTGAAEGALRADNVDLALLERGEASGLELVANDRPDEDSELGRFTAAVSQSLGLRPSCSRRG